MKVAFVAQDDLSTPIFAAWYARHFRSRPDIEFCTIGSVGMYRDEVTSLGTRHIAVDGYRFVHPYKDQRARTLPNLIRLDFRKDVRELYAMADLAVLPSYYKEGGYPRALLEPMALGKPVIAADTDDCRGPVEDLGNGYLVPPRDAAALARSIDALYLDRGTGRRFGGRSLEIMRSCFDDEIVGRQVLAELGIGA